MNPPPASRTPSFSRRQFTGGLAAAAGLLALGRAAGGEAATDALQPARRGICGIRRNPKALDVPVDVPPGPAWRYGLSYPFQVAADLGGLYCNLKVFGGPGQDFGGGVDIVLLGQPGSPRVAKAVTVARNSPAPNPNNGGRPAIMVKSPGLAGFVPLGAKHADGRPHPHAGTGFALVPGNAWPTGPGETPDFAYPDRIGYGSYTGEKNYRTFDLYQLRFDGAAFTVSPPERLDRAAFGGLFLASTGMGCAIADGDDLLCGLTGLHPGGTATGAGLARWVRRAGAWRPADFEFVTPPDGSMEPSLVRDLDGSLLLFARAPRAMGPPVRIWRQPAPGRPWELRINVNRLIPSVPATLSRAADGTPYLASNLYQPQLMLPAGLNSDGGVDRLGPAGRRGERSTVCLWPLNAARDGFDLQFVVRDPLVEFGPPPHGTIWAADHPTGGVVRLADGQWRSLLGYRLLEWKENTHFIPPGPRTGGYLDEVLSFGPPVPPWNF